MSSCVRRRSPMKTSVAALNTCVLTADARPRGAALCDDLPDGAPTRTSTAQHLPLRHHAYAT